LLANAIVPAPAGLAATVIGSAVATPIATAASWWSMKSALTAVSAAVATVAVVTSLQFRRELARSQAAAEAERAAASEQLRRALDSRSAAPDSTDSLEELARLRAEHLELLRLRGEVTRLQRQLAEAGKQKAPPTPAATAEAPVDDEQTRTTQIVVEARIAHLNEAAARSFGMKAGATGVLTEPQAATLLRSLEQAAGVTTVAMPRVTTLSGRQAQLTISTEPGSSGDPAGQSEVAYVLDVLPVFDLRTRSCILSLGSGVARPAKLDGQPENDDASNTSPTSGRSRRAGGPPAKTMVTVPDGQSVVWTPPVGASWPRDVAGTAASPRNVMVIITATCIDPAGNRLFEPGEASNASPSDPTPTAASGR
jgi:hypothetical protein